MSPSPISTTFPRRPPRSSGRSPSTRPLAAMLALALALAAAGCGAPSADPVDGRKALQTALDAWKAGETPKALAVRTPAITVSDGDWAAGLALQGYKADDEGKLVGADLNYKVVLELKNRKGKVTSKTAVYAVSTHPQLLVLRQDD